MAKVQLNPLMERIRGKIGDLVFRRFQDEMIVGRRPNRDGFVPSAAQVATVDRFRRAAAYGRAVFADPAQKEVYAMAARTRGQGAFSLALADYLNPPVVDVLDVSGYHGHVGDIIAVEASDDFTVVGVKVVVRNDAGEAVEEGPALPVNGRWHYAATVAVAAGETLTIEATATDRPGHSGTKSVLIVLQP